MAIDDNTSYELTGAQVKDLANKIKAKAADNIFVGATSAAPGSKGLVPAPQAADDTKFLCGDGTWKTAGGTEEITIIAMDDMQRFAPAGYNWAIHQGLNFYQNMSFNGEIGSELAFVDATSMMPVSISYIYDAYYSGKKINLFIRFTVAGQLTVPATFLSDSEPTAGGNIITFSFVHPNLGTSIIGLYRVVQQDSGIVSGQTYCNYRLKKVL